MEANLTTTLTNLKQVIKQLSVSDRRVLLKWLVELLQHEPQHQPQEQTSVNVDAVYRICDEIRDLPVLDHRSPDEIIGYNEFGGLD